MAWLALLFSALVLFITFLWLKQKKMKKKKKKNSECIIPHGSTGWPLIGETLHFISSGYSHRPFTFMEKRRLRYGKVFKTHLLGTPIIVSTDAEVNRMILHNHGSSFVPAYPKSIREILGEYSILQMEGHLHRRLHSIIASFFKSSDVKAQATKDMEEAVKLSLSSWKPHSLVLVQQETKNIAFQILVKVLMGVGPGEELHFMKKEFGELLKGLICVPLNFPGTRMYKSLKAKGRVMEAIRKRVMEIKERKEEERERMGVVELLLREGGLFSRVEFVCENIVGMMIPGEETMPTAMTLAVKYLSDTPAALQRTVEENMELEKKKKEQGAESYTWMDYMSLSFTQNVISETLRLANIINGIWRKAVKDVQIKGYMIPKGWCVLASLLSVHMDDENFEDPYRFNPWRWEGNGEAVIQGKLVPFGGGQRLCPGFDISRLEISIFLHHLVTTYRWEAEEDDIVSFPTVKMKRNLPIVVTPLSNSFCT